MTSPRMMIDSDPLIEAFDAEPGDSPDGLAPWAPSISSPSITAQSPTDDLLQVFLRDVGRVRLLTHEEELALGKSIRSGGSEARQAREKLIRANIRLVISIARRYPNQGIGLMDLIQEGCIGLMKAVDKFDYRRGLKFSTYATWWIRQSVVRAIANHAKAIRLPIHMGDKIRDYKAAFDQLSRTLGREPSRSEIAQQLKLSEAQIEHIQQAMTRTTTSLSTPLGDDLTLEDALADQPGDDTIVERLIQTRLSADVREALNQLSPREQKILKARYGFDSSKRLTLEAVGKQLGYSKERIRQIELRSLKKLKHNPVLQDLCETLS